MENEAIIAKLKSIKEAGNANGAIELMFGIATNNLSSYLSGSKKVPLKYHREIMDFKISGTSQILLSPAGSVPDIMPTKVAPNQIDTLNLVNQRLKLLDTIEEFCNKNNCTPQDLMNKFNEKPTIASQLQKVKESMQSKPASGGYDRRKEKLGF